MILYKTKERSIEDFKFKYSSSSKQKKVLMNNNIKFAEMLGASVK